MVINWYDWLLVAMVFGIFARLCIFKVPDVHIGIPSSLFSGRYGGKDEKGNSLPIKSAYLEGVHFKPPWWSVEIRDRKVATQNVDRQAYQVGGRKGTQGSVDITGIIQYRISQKMAFRRLEVSVKDIQDGLDAEFDFLLGKMLGEESIMLEEVITMKGALSGNLFKQLTRYNSDEEEFPDDNWCGREIDGQAVTWAEQRFGIEILKVNINRIDPSGDLKKERDQRQAEIYQRESQTVEWKFLLDMAKELKKQHPDLSDQEILREIQTWQKNASRMIVDAPDTLSAFLANFSKTAAKKMEGGK
jgi:regulator of protease activity HflC (stomatin/prohibitin superfamily)